MIRSEILKEKDRIQAKLSEESLSIHDYFERSHIAAKKIAESYGFPLKYAELPTYHCSGLRYAPAVNADVRPPGW